MIWVNEREDVKVMFVQEDIGILVPALKTLKQLCSDVFRNLGRRLATCLPRISIANAYGFCNPFSCVDGRVIQYCWLSWSFRPPKVETVDTPILDRVSRGN
jgi:hypothetical protein